MSTLLIMAVGAGLPHTPLATALDFVPVPPICWLLLVTLACFVGLTQLEKNCCSRSL